ncbi:hypothetical protein LguiA_009321 [Lonicera macranthoides]
MSLVSWAKKELARLMIRKPRRLLLPRTTMDSVKSSTMSPVPEVLLVADLRCVDCQMRVAHVIPEMDGVESMVVHVLEKKVTITLRAAN